MNDNPIIIEIFCEVGRFNVIEVVAVTDRRQRYASTGRLYRLYEGCCRPASLADDHLLKQEKYLESIYLLGKAHPGFLGELHFNGYQMFEWKYTGYNLTERDIYRIVSELQDACQNWQV